MSQQNQPKPLPITNLLAEGDKVITNREITKYSHVPLKGHTVPEGVAGTVTGVTDRMVFVQFDEQVNVPAEWNNSIGYLGLPQRRNEIDVSLRCDFSRVYSRPNGRRIVSL